MTPGDWERVVRHLRVAAIIYEKRSENPSEKNKGVIKAIVEQLEDALDLAERIERGER